MLATLAKYIKQYLGGYFLPSEAAVMLWRDDLVVKPTVTSEISVVAEI